ncbi:MAG: porphobilinogen synthase [Verrucomicrobia bacterium]|nr:porphobilinogen synthase [Verrucomicrobiota bacterium]
MSANSLFSIPLRLRRNRRTEAIRNIVQETRLSPSDLTAPFFIIEGSKKRIPIQSMPGVEWISIDCLLQEASYLHERGVQSICLFPVINPKLKSNSADEAWNSNGLLPQAIRCLKREIPTLCVIADVALDPFTIHGHDGLVDSDGKILNDETIECLIRMSLMQAEAGVDFVSPSDMMDGRVQQIRNSLDREGWINTGILSYSAKYASSLYSPFREALNVNLQFGDKKTYQMDPANSREALLEAKLDEEEGADILMVKPATFYLDVISKLRGLTQRPIAAYHVSGEYAMVMAAGQMGYLDPDKVFYEALLSIKRAGADLIFTYAIKNVLDRM